MAELTSRQRAHLRGLAHPLKPIMQIGKEGVTPAALRSTRQMFNKRELLKVRILEAAPEDVRQAAEQLASELEDARVVQVMGSVVTLYRPHPQRPEIKLPN